MGNIPTEGSPAGNALAAMLVIAPFVAVLLGSFVRPTWLAFIAAVLGGGGVIAAGCLYALDVAPGSGTNTGVMLFGAAAGLLTCMMAALTSVTRAMHYSQKAKDALAQPPAG